MTGDAVERARFVFAASAQEGGPGMTLPPPKLYELSGPLGGNGNEYSLRLVGPTIDAAAFRKLIQILTMTAEWLEEDAAAGNVDPIEERMAELAATATVEGGRDG